MIVKTLRQIQLGKSLRSAIQSAITLVLAVGFVALTSIASPVLAATGNVARPFSVNKFAGIYDPSTSPPSATNAVSPTRIIELVNSRYLIASRNGKGTSGPISNLVGTPGVFLSDPQVIWDPLTNRFYFSLFENRGTTSPEEGIAWGFSTTATPNTPADFCTYFNQFNYGSTSFPDRQSLGDTANFLLIGANRWGTNPENLLGSDVAWITKPPAGTTCPTQSSFQTGIQSLENPNGTAPYTPTPARQVDSGSTGWIVATPTYASNTALTLFSVTQNPTTGGAIISAPVTLPVPAYSNPPYAPQAGTTSPGNPAPPLETRIYLTQVIMAFDPRVGHTALWTANTIAGGAGSEAQWYEINPAADTLDQVGTVSDPNLYVFNATIAPDRLVNGSTAEFGSDMVMTFSTSSATTDAAIQMVSKIGAGPQSPLKLVKQSPAPDIDGTCFEPGANSCRWGDYSGASPDPGASPTAKQGRVWLSNQWNVASTSSGDATWRTIVWQVKP